MKPRTKIYSLVGTLAAIIATVALAAGFDQINSGYLKIGNGTSATKTLEFNVGNTTSDPILTGDSSNNVSLAAASFRLLELPANGVNYVEIKVPTAITSNTTITLPSTAPTGVNGSYLAATTSGVLSWSTSTGTGSVVLNNIPTITDANLIGSAITIGAGNGFGIPNSVAGTTTIHPPTTGSNTLTMPAATDTLVGKATTDVFTNKSIDATTNTLTNIANASISSSAAIAYSKLNLATSIVNADVSTSAAIAYSKLALGTSIVNADVSASAAIVGSKLAAATGSLTGTVSGEETGTFAVSFTGPRSFSVTMAYSRVGKNVTLSWFDAIGSSCTGNSLASVANSITPATLKPSREMYLPIWVQNNNAPVVGYLGIAADGSISGGQAGLAAFTNGANCGIYRGGLSYTTN